MATRGPSAETLLREHRSERACREGAGGGALQAARTVRSKALGGFGETKVTGVAECTACLCGEGPDPGL